MLSSAHSSERVAVAQQGIALLGLFVALMHLASADDSTQTESRTRTFTVRDSIELTRVLDFGRSGSNSGSTAETALFSPDGSRFLIRTRRGDLERNVNVESLLVFSTSEVESYLLSARPDTKPRAQVLSEIDVSRERGQISQIRWLNDSEVGFIAQGGNGTTQAFAASVERNATTQLTHSPTDVHAFAMSGDTLLFFAQAALGRPLAMAVESRPIVDLLDPNYAWWVPTLELYRTSAGSATAERLNFPVVRLYRPFHRIWISPRADYAVTFAPSVDAPKHWVEYRVPQHKTFGYTPESVRSDWTSADLMFRTRYQLIDLRRNTIRPLLDAPSGWLALNLTPPEVIWPKDVTKVIISNTYLPLNVRNKAERVRRKRSPATAEIDLRTGDATPIAWEIAWDGESSLGQQAGAITSITWSAEGSVLSVTSRTDKGDVRIDLYRKTGATWGRTFGRDGAATTELDVQRREGLHERPRVFAGSAHCTCAKEIFDPDARAEQFTFGAIEAPEWTTPGGITWHGGFVLPPRHSVERRHPLVVQTHGFNPEVFLIDGHRGTTTAMAAQALANAGIAVLQVEDSPRAKTGDNREAMLFAEGYRTGIENLVAKGLVDPARVGLIAFSRTGLPTIRLLADNPNLLSAVSIADAAWWGYLNDLLLVNAPSDIAAQIRDAVGGSPSPDGIAQWMASNPLYAMPRAKAAIRLEAMGPISLLAHWEHFALLRRCGRPVDFIYFPQGSHNLYLPAERLASQGGSVDWFRFWLMDYEDPDLGKHQQYVRWRALRDLVGGVGHLTKAHDDSR